MFGISVVVRINVAQSLAAGVHSFLKEYCFSGPD